MPGPSVFTRTHDLTGQRFSMLVAVSLDRAKSISAKTVHWECQCDCGKTSIVAASRLKNGTSRSCGCLVKTTRKVQHGMCGTSEYQTWRNIRMRCKNKNTVNYKYYGARGITVCERWDESFQNFYDDMGLKPTPEHSIERIDNDGNYEPSNCMWALMADQSKNKRAFRTAL